ncbi:diguanylate cyclase (GGDEF)-like protein/PAS domain S-box-containing protein [Rhodoferax ferrireducens]|uniref:Diguanylate cyclase (GGDEF)-like protein/PAS domain S-box-containing protein n=1 Tax=Rhodoferax ferrireducens TaxID=192843 RepID=A0ABU2C6Q6_9BURK|nr:EAL domain-containing protein [Rhodoferax ferrireducens]MDR7377024.1 diguanylate cyclase (GGDEF)-like protein/PAS domain S-box-containing protein [Rhodoferax ferrireducens]
MSTRSPRRILRAVHIRLIGCAVFVATAVAAALLIWNMEQRREQGERARIDRMVSDRAYAIQATMERALSSTYALSAMVHQAGGEFSNFEGVASEMLRSYPGVSILGLSPGGIIRQVVPLAGNERSIGFNQLKDPVQGKEARLAMQTGKLTLAGPLNLVQGGLGVVGRLPVYLSDVPGVTSPENDRQFWGFVYVVIKFPGALAGSGLEQLTDQGIAYQLWRTVPDTQQRQTIATSGSAPLISPVNRDVLVPNGRWTFSAAPVRGWGDPAGLGLKIALGLLFSALLAWAAQLLLQLKRQEHDLEAQVAERTREIFATQNKLEATLDAIPDLLFELGLDSTVYDCRLPPSMQADIQLKELLGNKATDILPATAANVVTAALEEARQTGHSEGAQFELPFAQKQQWFEISVARKDIPGDAEPRFIMLARNITQRMEAELDLRIAATAFNAQDGMAITNAQRLILRCNPAFTQITGYSQAEAVGQSLNMLNSGRHARTFYQAMWDSVEATGTWRGEVWNRRKNGEIYPDARTTTAVRNAHGEVTHYVNTFNDITQRKAAEEEINQLAFYDPLTHLPNRRLLLDRLRHALTQHGRNGHFGALQFIDLDNFKALNDTLGHDMGDLLLQQVAARLTECVRAADTVARLGGDEFVVLLAQLGSSREAAAAHAEAVGEKVRDAITRPYNLAAHQHELSASIGITLYQGPQDSIDDLLKQADLAMYQAKSAGRNTLRFYDPQMQAVVNARVALEGDIRRGLAQQQFQLYYQVQVDGRGHTVGAEALLRWPHPQRGMVPPNEFIHLAEDTGLIIPLGHWVLQTACTQLRLWSLQTHTRHLTLAVNVSARQFRQPEFAESVLQVLQDTGAPAHLLKLELTESLLVNDVEDTIAKMHALKMHGVGFSLDDFGTGYSSLSYLKRLPLEQLKIDQSFVQDLLSDPNDAAIARTVIALGHSLGLAVIAEGVETALHQEFLALAGCDAYQGYLFGRPMPVQAFEDGLLSSPRAGTMGAATSLF